MVVQVGSRLGHYDVTALIGEGGMGQVYQATDTTLDRDVALKVLPDAFTQDPDRLARFEREAKVLASLNHPNIGAIYGLEKSGDTRALVLELVEGPTLADRIKQGPIPLDEALPIAKQIAEALEAAHEAGVIHRDLKPANIKVRDDGTVKVLDFGLAKALDLSPVGDPSQSPTLTAAATQMGVIMGTAAYMSPEQARGKPVDKRADIWAFGCVLYEMLTGRRAFDGRDISEILAAVIKSEPDWTALAPVGDAGLRRLVRRCLQKEPQQRIRDVGDVRLDMMETAETDTAEPPARRNAFRLAVALLVAFCAGLLVMAVSQDRRPTAGNASRVMRLDVVPTTEALGNGPGPDFVISRDGSRMAYLAEASGRTMLYIRALDEFESVPVAGTEGAEDLFYCPYGDWIGFESPLEQALMKVSFAGDAPEAILDYRNTLGAACHPDGGLILALLPGLVRIPAGGGEPQQFPPPSESQLYSGPHVLPGGKAVVLMVGAVGDFLNQTAAVLSLDTGELTELFPASGSATYTPTGHLVFAGPGAIMAAPFSLPDLRPTGDPVPLVRDVTQTSTGVEFALSETGTLLYRPAGEATSEAWVLSWVDENGRVEPAIEDLRGYRTPRLSPDGNRVAVAVTGREGSDLWVYDLTGRPPTRLTSRGLAHTPVWSPDGTRVVFTYANGGKVGLFNVRADGSQEAPEQILEAPRGAVSGVLAGGWLPDDTVVFTGPNVAGEGRDIASITSAGERTEVVSTQFNEDQAALSPSGDWLAFVSDRDGARDVYAQEYPDGLRYRVSTNGGELPTWAPDGEHLFYRRGNWMMSVEVNPDRDPSFGAPEESFEISEWSLDSPAFTVSSDGRFLVVTRSDESGSSRGRLRAVVNWFEELKELVPSN